MAYPPIKKLRFPTGRSQKSLNRDKIILSLGQEISGFKTRLENIEVKISEPTPSTQATPEVEDQLSKSLAIVKNIGNLKTSESDSTYEKENSLEMEKEMEMEE